MANEVKKTYATTVNHVVDGSAVSDAAFSSSSDIDTTLTSTNTSDYPYADVVLTVTMTSAPSAVSPIYLYRKDNDLVSTSDSPDPATGYKHKLVGAFMVPAGTSTYYLSVHGVELTKACDFYIENQTGVATHASTLWDLDVTPWTYAPAT